MLKLILGAAAGCAAAWFLDPNDGTRRRRVARDKAGKYARRGKDEAVRRADYVAGRVKGAARQVSPVGGREEPAERLNDPALQAKVESEIFREPDAPKDRVSVNVENGVVYLRGELEDSGAIERLAEAAGNVGGVRAVENLLHMPGEPAPTKDESRDAAGTAGS
jgi:osmotically-inducible protein OsmY